MPGIRTDDIAAGKFSADGHGVGAVFLETPGVVNLSRTIKFLGGAPVREAAKKFETGPKNYVAFACFLSSQIELFSDSPPGGRLPGATDDYLVIRFAVAQRRESLVGDASQVEKRLGPNFDTKDETLWHS